MGREFDISIIGAGAFGTTLASVLAANNKQVLMWTRREELAREITDNHTNERYLPGFKLPEGIRTYTDLKRVVRGSDVVLMVVPSKFFKVIAQQVGDVIEGDQILIHATKGIPIAPFKRMSEIIREETPALKIGVFAGPNLAKEIMAGKGAGAVIASKFDEVSTRVQALFRGSRIRLYRGRDIIGVEVAGAFKNVVALAAGALDGMDLGSNMKALLITRGLNEMTRFGTALGAKPLTFLGLAGIGDLMATCTSRLSRNNQVGYRLAKGETLEEIQRSMNHVAEGVTTAKAIYNRALQLGLDLHIIKGVYKVLYEGLSVVEGMHLMMSSEPGREINFEVGECGS